MSFESPEPDTEPPAADAAAGEEPVSGDAAPAGGEASAPLAPDEAPAPSASDAPSEPVTTEQAAPAPEAAAGEPAAGKRPPQQRRRRRPSAADRHRRAFYARLTEVRKQGDAPSQAEPVASEAPPAAEAEGAEPAPAAQASPSPEAAPAPGSPEAAPTPAEQPAPAEQAAAPTEQAGQPSDQRSGRSQARLVAAVEGVGGPDVVREALSPQRREDGQNQKWSAVCCDRAAGLKPGDPVFQAWVRLASTPVREVKSVAAPAREDRPRRGRRNDQRGRGDGQERPQRGSASGGDMAALGRDGSFRPTVRIVGLEDAEASKREREETRRAERDAKRQAEAERLARLGY